MGDKKKTGEETSGQRVKHKERTKSPHSAFGQAIARITEGNSYPTYSRNEVSQQKGRIYFLKRREYRQGVTHRTNQERSRVKNTVAK